MDVAAARSARARRRRNGKATLAEIANILGTFDLPEETWHSPREIHLMAEAWKRAFADRNEYLADPDVSPDIPLTVLTSADYGRSRAGSIDGARATASLDVTPGVEGYGGAPAREPAPPRRRRGPWR